MKRLVSPFLEAVMLSLTGKTEKKRLRGRTL